MHWGGPRMGALAMTGGMIWICSTHSGWLGQHIERNQGGTYYDNAAHDNFFNVSDRRSGPSSVLLLGGWCITTRGHGHPDGRGVHGS